MKYLGDFKEDATVYVMFNTFTSDDPSASSTITNFANTDVHIHKDDSDAQRNNAAGITVSIDFDGITGSHMIKIDTSDDTVGAFWVVAHDYFVRIEGVTVDGATINAVVAHFSIENRNNQVDVTHLLGTAWLTPGVAGTPDVNTKTITNDAITAAAIKAAAIDNATFAADVGSTAHGTNIIALAVRKILEELNLDHLLKVTTGVAADADLEDYVVAGTVMAHALSTGADVTTFKPSTDSLEAIKVHADTIKAETALIVEDTGTTLDTLIKAIPTNTEFAALLGAINTAANTGNPAADVTVMGYIKQLINILIGDAGITDWDAEQAPANGINISEVLRAIHADVTGLNGSAMVGTNGANTTVPDAAGVAPTAAEIKTALEVDGGKLDHLWEMTEDDVGVRRLTENALEEAPSGTGASAATIADAVLNELLSGHTTAGSLSKAISDILTDTGTTLDTLIKDIPTVAEFEARSLVTADYTIVSDLPSEPPTTAQIKTAMEVDGSKLDHIWETTEDDTGVRRFTANALEEAPTGSGSGLDAAGVRTAIGMAAANLDTQIGTVDTVVDAIKLKTDTLGGAGAISWTYTLTAATTGNPIPGADVWATTDEAGTDVVASGVTDTNGKVTFYLDAATYYIFRQLSGWNFDNPDTEVVS